MKRIIKKTMPFVLAVLIVFQSVYLSVQTAQASAIPEVLYYTYWDLINTIYATCGYDSKVDESVVNNHSVTGKQAWDNFVTFVENSAKANYKFVGDGMSKAFSELENLVNTATENGISMTQDLYDMLKSVFADQVAYSNVQNRFDVSSVDKIYNELIAWTGSSGYLNVTELKQLASYVFDGEVLNIVRSSGGVYYCFLCDKVLFVDIKNDTNTFPFYYFDELGNKISLMCINYSIFPSSKEVYVPNSSVYVTVGKGYSWVVKGGSFVGTDTISAQVSAGACPKEVPDVAPWRKSVDIPDEWRRANPKESPDQDSKKHPEILVPIIPIINPTKPGSSEDTTEKPSTETPENVDPNTGWDIDPSTGKLINPITGELVDPFIFDPSSITDKFGDITKLFPFCIPFDLVRLIKGMSAVKHPPVFRFRHEFKSINYTFVVDVDLSDYDKYIKLFRYGMQIFYVLALMFLTAKISTYFA